VEGFDAACDIVEGFDSVC